MTYEYFEVARKGRPDPWVQGEALDTMHDGAWLGVALVEAARATGDPYYRDFLTQWTLPADRQFKRVFRRRPDR